MHYPLVGDLFSQLVLLFPTSLTFTHTHTHTFPHGMPVSLHSVTNCLLRSAAPSSVVVVWSLDFCFSQQDVTFSVGKTVFVCSQSGFLSVFFSDSGQTTNVFSYLHWSLTLSALIFVKDQCYGYSCLCSLQLLLHTFRSNNRVQALYVGVKINQTFSQLVTGIVHCQVLQSMVFHECQDRQQQRS